MPENQDICWMSAVELAKAIKEKKLSPVEVVNSILERIENINPKINAYVTLTAETAIVEAKQAEDAVMKGDELGPLHGVPVSIKDLIFTKGVRTTMGSKLYEDFVPDEDAVVVTRLKQAGAIVLGKTNAPEFGLKPVTFNEIFGVTRNPWNLERTPGGSSGGAGAAVASGLGPFAVGSDGGGSIRIPSSCCGLFGIKPQFGRVPRYPILHGAEIITHEGPIARTVGDAALMLDVISGPHWGDVYSIPKPETSFVGALNGGIKGMRIGCSPDLGYVEPTPEVVDICKRAVNVFIELGAVVEEAHPGFENPENLPGIVYGTDHLEAFSYLGPLDEVLTKVDQLTMMAVVISQEVKGTDYARMLFAKHDLAAKTGKFLQSYDLLLTPTLTAPPYPVDFDDPIGYWKWVPFTIPFNFTGQPAASIPAGWTEDGLPVGLQIVGRQYDEATVFRAAAAFEEAQPWAHKKPRTVLLDTRNVRDCI